jgi:hypothetical protein
VINVHRDPDPLSEVVTQARLGDVADVTGRPKRAPSALRRTSQRRAHRTGGSWLHLRFRHDGYTGWAAADGFVPGDWPPPSVPVVRTSSLFANLHAGPGVRTPLLFTAPLGAPLARTGDAVEGWLPVLVPGALPAFVQPGDVCNGASAWQWNTAADLNLGLVRQGRAMLGLPYRWGGTTPFGLDCSGFIQLLFRLHGVDLPRDAGDQLRDRRLTEIPREALAAGDLLFFRQGTHVGLAVSPDGFIHATTAGSPQVQVTAVDDPHWAALRDGYRRVMVR